MKQGEMVLVHLSEEQIAGLKGNKLSPMPAVVVSIWQNEYPQHPKCTTGVNVRVFTDSNDNPLWLTSLPMKFDGVKEMFGSQTATFEVIHKSSAPSQFQRTNSAQELVGGVPRRIRLDLNEPAELAITNAIQEVEKMPADVRLTEAQILLGKAKDKVSDFIDNKQ